MKVPQPMMGGALATAGGLVFTGEGNGNFNAYDSRTGKLLWQFNGGAGCNSAPMSFRTRTSSSSRWPAAATSS